MPPSGYYCPLHRIVPSCTQDAKCVLVKERKQKQAHLYKPNDQRSREMIILVGGTLICALSSVQKGEFKQLFTGQQLCSGLYQEGQSESELDPSSSTALNFFYFNSQDFKWQNQHTT